MDSALPSAKAPLKDTSHQNQHLILTPQTYLYSWISLDSPWLFYENVKGKGDEIKCY